MTGAPSTLPVALPEPLTRQRLEPWIKQEMASDRQTERLLWSTGLDGFDEIPHPSKILRERSLWSQRVGDLHDDMLLKCPPLSSTYGKIFDSVLALSHPILPGDATPRGAEAAELCRYSLGRISNLDIIRRHWLGARPRGLAVTEVVWDYITRGPWRGALVPVDLIDRPLRRFAFRRSDKALAIRRFGDRRFAVAPPGKFLVFRQGTKDSPWGAPQLDYCYWPAWYYQHGAVYYALYLERRADPVPDVSYPWKAGGEQANKDLQGLAERVLQGLLEGQGTSHPEDITTRFLEPTQSGAISYSDFMGFWARAIGLEVLGEIKTSGLHPAHGSYASDEVAKSLFIDRIASYASALAAAWKDELLRMIVEVNFGPDVAIPHHRIDISSADERRLRIDGLRLARELEMAVAEDDAHSVTGMRRPRPGQTVLEWPRNPQPSTAELSELGWQNLELARCA